MFPAISQAAMISSPCLGVCRMDSEGLCVGCHRSLREIAGWSAMSEQQRQQLMRETLPLRAAERKV